MSKAVKVQVDLYYDVISPYSWIAFEALQRYKTLWPIELNLKPFFLKSVMKATGNKPPLVVPAKGLYMLKDLERNNSFWGMDMKPPTNFPKWVRNPETTTENAQKILIALQMEKREELVEDVTRAFWQRLWHEGKPIFSSDDIREVLESMGVSDSQHWIDRLSCSKVAEQLNENTEMALDNGCFGAPWIVVHKDGEEHGFFGSDRFSIIAHLIGNGARFTDGQTHLSKL